jgi:hypothetical protein
MATATVRPRILATTHDQTGRPLPLADGAEA